MFALHNAVNMATPQFIGSAIALLIPHFLYHYIWNNAAKFNRRCHPNTVRTFHFLVLFFKVFQVAAYAVWYTVQPKPEIMAFAIVLLICGTALNSLVYRKLGYNGVYYGFKFGHKVEWNTGFPFNVVRHPQYVGSLLSFAGLGCLVAHPGIQNEIITLFLLQVIAYIGTGWMESAGDQDKVLRELKKDADAEKNSEAGSSPKSKSSPSPMKKRKSLEGGAPVKKGSPSKMKRSSTPNPTRAR